MLRIGILEDEQYYQQQIEQYLQQYQADTDVSLQYRSFPSALELLQNYAPCYDLLFLDIRMADMDGMEAAESIRARDPGVLIIFVTTLGKYAAKSYEVDALDFLVKPVSYAQFKQRMDRAVRIWKRDSRQYLLLPTQEGQQRIDLHEVLYIEVSDHKLQVVTQQGILHLRGSMAQMEAELSDRHFSRCNHCYLVNLRNVVRMDKDTVTVGGHTLSVSRPKRKQFLQDLTAYLGEGL